MSTSTVARRPSIRLRAWALAGCALIVTMVGQSANAPRATAAEFHSSGLTAEVAFGVDGTRPFLVDAYQSMSASGQPVGRIATASVGVWGAGALAPYYQAYVGDQNVTLRTSLERFVPEEGSTLPPWQEIESVTRYQRLTQEAMLRNEPATFGIVSFATEIPREGVWADYRVVHDITWTDRDGRILGTQRILPSEQTETSCATLEVPCVPSPGKVLMKA